MHPPLQAGWIDRPHQIFRPGDFALESGAVIRDFELSYVVHGEINAAGSNVVLALSAISSTHHRLDFLIGAGRALDAARFAIIAVDAIGNGLSTSPSTSTTQPGIRFPQFSIRDMVESQRALLDHLGIGQLHAVVGASMGGMQALQWAAAYPERVFSALTVACSTRHSAQNIAFHELGRQAVMADPDWRAGRYFEEGTHPRRGLGVARMAAHITYLSDAALHRKFGRRLQDRELPTFSFDADFEVESYLRHQGSSFVERFDANSYLYLTRAMDYFDVAADHQGVLAEAYRGSRTRFCVVSFTSDWLFPTSESRAVVHALNASGARVSFAEIVTDRGHDAFLLDVPEFIDIARAFLESAASAHGLTTSR